MQIAPLVEKLAKSKAQYIANRMVSDTVLQCLKSDGTKYEDILILEKDVNGNIKAETANIVAMNNLKSQIHSELNLKLDDIKNEDISIPVGTLVGYDVLANVGPKIPVHLAFNGNVLIDYVDSFSAVGINQTKHSVSLVAKVEVLVMLGARNVVCNIDSSIPIAETIIVGDVPNSYLLFDPQI
jgi:sporulation protein YunB